jgi:hypothetical protein
MTHEPAKSNGPTPGAGNTPGLRTFGHVHLRLSNRIRHASFVVRHFLLLALFAPAFLAGCYERKQTALLNPDGSGKIRIETTVVVPAQGAPGQEKTNAVAYGRLVAADLINLTRGVDAWSELSITEVVNPPDHPGPVRASIAVTA